jgi:hypothetical protein
MAKKKQRSDVIWAEGKKRDDPNASEKAFRKLMHEAPQSFEPALQWLIARLELEPPEFLEFLFPVEAQRRLISLWYQDDIPSGTGQFSGIWRVPYINGVSQTFTVERAIVHVNTQASSAPTFSFEVSDGDSAPSWSVIKAVTLATSTYEKEETSSFTTGTIESGQILRVNVTTVGADYDTITCQLEAQVN